MPIVFDGRSHSWQKVDAPTNAPKAPKLCWECHRGYKILLTLRQYEILCHMVAGKTSCEIAREMDLSEKTIKNYKRGLYAALGVQDAVQAVALALRNGIVSMEAVP